MPIFLIFLMIPFIEIALFITVGGWIGLWPTLANVVLTAANGAWLVRIKGLKAQEDLSLSMNRLSDPATPLAHGAMILLAGALLLTPGFFTDTLGFLLLVPGLRSRLMRAIAARVTVARFSYGQAGPAPRDDVVDGDYSEVRPEPPPELPREVEHDPKPTHEPPQGPSGWTRH
jgi:UPF0716 protein FxsA